MGMLGLHAVEVPTYADLFPELDGPANAGQQASIWSTATGAVKPSTTTQVSAPPHAARPAPAIPHATPLPRPCRWRWQRNSILRAY